MPDQLAHIRFAREVLAAAEPSVRARVCVDSMAFRCGTFGPDPLFNDPLPSGRAEGFGLHHRPGRVALERMREPVRSRMPWAADYAAGFFCHYALDRLTHPLLRAMAANGEARHLAVETAYDRRLFQRRRGDMPAWIHLSPSALRAACAMYEGISPARFRTDLAGYWLSKYVTLYRGFAFLAPLPKLVTPAADGLIPYAKPSPGVVRGMERLEDCIAESILPAADQLNRYFAAIDADLPLDPWTDADFAGSFADEK